MISLLVIILLMIFFLYTKDSIAEQMLFQAYHNLYYHLIMRRIISFLMPFFVTVIMMDHDQAYSKPIYAYFGRKRVLISKIALYVLIITWIYLVIGIIYHMLPSMMTSYYLLNTDAIPFLIHIYLDGLILAILILWKVRDKHKAFAIFIPLFYTLIGWLYEDYQMIAIYYLIPFYSHYFSSFTLAYLYKLCYILLGLAITTKLTLHEEIK